MSKVSYACLQYLDDKIKYYYAPIETIFYKKNDQSPIVGKDLLDFDKTHKYYVLWSKGKNEVPISGQRDDESEFYAAYIVCLGETEDDARLRAISKSKRLIVPKKITSSESNESLFESQELKPKTGKIIKNVVQKVNSQRTIEKYKQITLMNNRKPLFLGTSTNEYLTENNARNVQIDSTIRIQNSKETKTMNLPEVRVVLQDICKTNRDELNHKKNVTIRNMVKCVSLPIAFSTPKRTVEKCSLSLNFQCHKPYERWTPQAEFTKSQQVNIHQNSLSLERDDNVSVSIPQFSPILNGSHLSQSQTPRRLRDKTPFRLQTLLTSTVNGPGDHHSPSVGVSKMRCNRLSTLQKIPRLDSPLPSDKRASQHSLSNASLNLDYIDQSDHSDLRMPSRSRRGRLPSIASDSSSRYKDISGPKSQSSTPFVPSNRLYSPVMSSPQEPSTPTRSCSEARSVRRSLLNSLSRSVAEFRTEQETPPRRTGPRSGAQEVVPTRTPPRRPGPRSVTQKVVPTRTPPRRPGPRSLTQVVVPTRTPPRRPGPRSQTQEVVPTRTPPRRPGSASPGREDIQDNEDENENLEVYAGGESDSAVPMLEQYKPKLLKKYNKAGYDLDSNIPEQHKRYDIVRNKIYLGEGRTIGQKSWRIIKSKRKNAFLRDLGTILWTKKVIALKSLDLSKLKKNTFGTKPIQLYSPRKLNLYLSLYSDFLDTSNRYKQLPQETKDILIKDATESLSFHSRDERKHQDEPND